MTHTTFPSPKPISSLHQTFFYKARRALRRHTKSSGAASALDEEMELMAEDDEETPLGAEAGTYDAEAIPAVGRGEPGLTLTVLSYSYCLMLLYSRFTGIYDAEIIRAVGRGLTLALIHSPTHSLTHLLTHTLTPSLTPSDTLFHTLFHTLSYPLSHPLSQTLSHRACRHGTLRPLQKRRTRTSRNAGIGQSPTHQLRQQQQQQRQSPSTSQCSRIIFVVVAE